MTKVLQSIIFFDSQLNYAHLVPKLDIALQIKARAYHKMIESEEWLFLNFLTLHLVRIYNAFKRKILMSKQ